MKKIYKYIVIAASALVAASCSDVLDIDPSNKFSENVVWGSQGSVDQYIYGFYGYLRESSEIGLARVKGFTDAYSDIIKSSSWDQYEHRFNMALLQESSFTATNAGAHECWGDAYNMIRRRNEFLRDAKKHPELGEDFIKSRVAEVRVLKAWCYYRLIRVYGGIVIRDEVDGPDQNDKVRSSEEESWQYVINELKAAAPDLPTSWDSGRITKQAAYGFLSRIALNGKQWKEAADAADSCAKYGGRLSEKYENIFSEASNPENLIVVYFHYQDLGHSADHFFRPVGDSKSHNNAPIYGAFAPTSELVDNYEMANGTPFSWAEHGNDPFVGREPRFYASILYNGARWENRTIETYVGENSSVENGADAITTFAASGACASSCTGYYLKKWITEDDHSWDKNNSNHFAIVLRYGEVLLNKAEALANENWSANKEKALAALNAVRARVDLPAKDASSLAEFMTLIEHERMVELAGEGLRFWDLRRWKRAVDVLDGKSMTGCKITKKADGTFTYKQVDIDAGRTRVFPERYYYFSVPETERSNNALFGKNNPGW